jgi:hypothetical protein
MVADLQLYTAINYKVYPMKRKHFSDAMRKKDEPNLTILGRKAPERRKTPLSGRSALPDRGVL